MARERVNFGVPVTLEMNRSGKRTNLAKTRAMTWWSNSESRSTLLVSKRLLPNSISFGSSTIFQEAGTHIFGTMRRKASSKGKSRKSTNNCTAEIWSTLRITKFSCSCMSLHARLGTILNTGPSASPPRSDTNRYRFGSCVQSKGISPSPIYRNRTSPVSLVTNCILTRLWSTNISWWAAPTTPAWDSHVAPFQLSWPTIVPTIPSTYCGDRKPASYSKGSFRE